MIWTFCTLLENKIMWFVYAGHVMCWVKRLQVFTTVGWRATEMLSGF